MNLWESLSNWTSSLSSSIFDERVGVVVDANDAFTDVFSWNNLTFSLDNFLGFVERFNSGFADTCLSANELFITFAQFANSVFGEVSSFSPRQVVEA